MSVVVGKRSETRLKVVDVAEKLANYTITMVTNEKRFPKRYRWIYAGKIGDSALNVNSLVHMANSIYPKNKMEMKERLRFIIKALAEVSNLLSLISLCRQQHDIDLDNVEYWLTTATYEKTLIMQWREANYKKLGDLPDE